MSSSLGLFPILATFKVGDLLSVFSFQGKCVSVESTCAFFLGSSSYSGHFSYSVGDLCVRIAQWWVSALPFMELPHSHTLHWHYHTAYNKNLQTQKWQIQKCKYKYLKKNWQQWYIDSNSGLPHRLTLYWNLYRHI